MKIAVAGATWATQVTIDALRRHGHAPTVFGQNYRDDIAGWVDLDPHVRFDKLNEEAAELWALDPDVLFVVGLSQLVSPEILRIPELGCVGFHPTMLPRGRGRAPIAWLILGEGRGAATFFELNERADAGPIFVQVPFSVGRGDYAADVCDRIAMAMDVALNDWLPRLDEWDPWEQDESLATYLGARRPEDGRINWAWPAEYIQMLVRASSRPHPGAFSGDRKIWRATVVTLPYYGVHGRVLGFDGEAPFVQTGLGLLRLDEFEGPPLRVGAHL